MSGYAGTYNIVGSGSLMPEAAYMRKIEQTCNYESPYLLENYHRSTLKDMRPLKPFFESDQPRGGFNADGTSAENPLSARFLDFRDTGRIARAEPYLPDGTFLDFQGLEKDQRGVAMEPNMRKHVEQQYARGGFYNYKPDADHSVPESGWNPGRARRDIRNAQTESANRMLIFDTSFTGRQNAGRSLHGTTSITESVDQDGRTVATAEDTAQPRQVTTTSLSNNTPMGWRRTTDHRFKVSKFGRSTAAKLNDSSNWYKNRGQVHIDHDLVTWRDATVTKAVALLMIDLSKQKAHTRESFKGTNFDASKQTQSARKIKLTPEDMAGMAVRDTEETRTADAHTDLNGESAPNNFIRIYDDSKKIYKTDINPKVFELMASINSKQADHKVKDLREKVKQTANSNYKFMTEKNNKQTKYMKSSLLREGIAKIKWGKEKKIFNYKASEKHVNGHNMDRISYEEFTKKSLEAKQRRGNIDQYEIQNVNTTTNDGDFAREYIGTKLIGGMGSKYTNQYHDRDGLDNDINDRSSRL
jgi:hypothetical protein